MDCTKFIVSHRKTVASLHRNRSSTFCLLLLLALAPLWLPAQIGSDIIPPPPDASALAKFIEHPVGHNTGIPQVAIPLLSWGHGSSGLAVELALSYHLGGVKVEEISGNVGLGWAITGLGSVSRSMRGLPDDHPNGFTHTPVLPAYNTLFYDGGYPDNMAYADSYLLSGLNGSDHTLLWELTSGISDGMQDVFYFTAGGSSGKFYIGKDKSILHHDHSNARIEVFYNAPTPGSPILWFRITDEQGLIYSYEEIEYTLDASPTGELVPVPQYASNWLLTKIEDPAQDLAITVTYGPVLLQYQSGFHQSMRVRENGLPGSTGPDTEFSSSHRNIEVTGRRVSEISFPDGMAVQFEYDTAPRQDLTDNRLKALHVGHPTGGSYSYVFQHGYFNPSGTVHQKRLRLDGLTMQGGAEQQSHAFTYHGPALPARNANHQDYWGYAVSSSRPMPNKIPKMRYTGSYLPLYTLLDGVDRSTDPVAVTAGSLQRITYPTKGYTQFEMEANTTYGTTAYHMDNVRRTFGFDQGDSGNLLTFHTDMSQALTSGHTYRLRIQETGRSGFPSFPYDWADLDTVSVRLVLRNAAGTWSKTIHQGTYLALSTAGFQVSGESIPAPGDYRLLLVMGNFTPFPVTFQGTLEQLFNTQFMDKPAGGLRVARIRDYTAAGMQALERHYTYQLAGGHSSGALPVLPNSSYSRLSRFMYSPVYMGAEQWLSRSSEPTVELAYVSGSPVLYSRVIEERIDPATLENNGRTEHEFHPLTYMGGYDILPFESGTVIPWLSGRPKKTSVYSHGNVLLSTIEYSYTQQLTYVDMDKHKSLKVGIAGEQNLLVGMPSTVTQYAARPVHPYTGYSRVSEILRREYHPGGTVAQTESFTYDDTYRQLRRHSRTQSDGQQRHTFHYYAYDYGTLPAFAALVSGNRIAAAVQLDQVLGSPLTAGVLSREFHQYALFAGHARWAGVYEGHGLSAASAPDVSPTDLTSGVLQPRMRVISYDPYGNPRELRQQNGPLTTYLWGYGGVHPIARITHADFAAVSGVIGASVITGFYATTVAAATIRTHLQSARGVMTASMLDDYTYSLPSGVAGITDPRGIPQQYQYDGLLRLKQVLDFNSYILQDFKYHYRP